MDPVDKLRAMTGAGLMACKRALAASQGSVEKAARHLRRAGEAPNYRRGELRTSTSAAAAERGYRFDTWVERIATSIDDQRVALIPNGPPLSVTVNLDDQGLWPVETAATLGSGNSAEIDAYAGWDPQEFAIPDSFDEEDVVLESFFDANLDNPALEIAAFSLADYFKLPGALWRLGLHQIARRIMELSEQRPPHLNSCVVRIHGETLTGREEDALWRRVGERLRGDLSDEKLFSAFSVLAYEAEPMRDRLKKLREGTSRG